MSLFTPARRMGTEVLDAPDVAPALVVRSHRDIARANRLFGGVRAVLDCVRRIAPRLPASPLIVDVGAGTGDVLDAVCALLRATGRTPRPVVVDTATELAPAARARGCDVICGSILALPLHTGAADLVLASQVVHHFTAAEIPHALRELHRIARHGVIVSDLRRSWIAAGGLWASSFPLGFHPVSRHDGVVSVLRGFTAAELRTLVRDSTGSTPDVRTHPGWRVTAEWSPVHAA